MTLKVRRFDAHVAAGRGVHLHIRDGADVDAARMARAVAAVAGREDEHAHVHTTLRALHVTLDPGRSPETVRFLARKMGAAVRMEDRGGKRVSFRVPNAEVDV